MNKFSWGAPPRIPRFSKKYWYTRHLHRLTCSDLPPIHYRCCCVSYLVPPQSLPDTVPPCLFSLICVMVQMNQCHRCWEHLLSTPAPGATALMDTNYKISGPWGDIAQALPLRPEVERCGRSVHVRAYVCLWTCVNKERDCWLCCDHTNISKCRASYIAKSPQKCELRIHLYTLWAKRTLRNLQWICAVCILILHVIVVCNRFVSDVF